MDNWKKVRSLTYLENLKEILIIIRKLALFGLCCILLVLTFGCKNDTIDSSTYKGKNLIIGVIGDAPIVREDNVTFKAIRFTDIRTSASLPSELDAIFITIESVTNFKNEETKK